MNFEKPYQANESENENNKIDYTKVLESIEMNNGRLKDIASKFLENSELLEIVPAQLKTDQAGYGVNSIREGGDGKIRLKGISINPEHMTEEVAVHELVHFFSMPALSSGLQYEQAQELDKLAENVKTYWLKTKALWNSAKSRGYEATNSHSIHDTIEEFAVNFTNEESEKKLKELNIYKALVDSFFEYYHSLKIKK
ncbi:MAG TPA: hypothetical protein PLJ58_01525 [bacterium]|nr:hypothetical protein [bacterium]